MIANRLAPEAAAVAEEEVKAGHHCRRGRKREEEAEHVAMGPSLGRVEIDRNPTAS